MPKLVPFVYKTHEVRIDVDTQHNPWWVAVDVGTALGYGKISEILKRLDPDEKGIRRIDTPGGPQDLWCVNEAGLYSLILGSKKPEARPFQRWVTHEVLPQIRQTGHYAPQAAAPDDPMIASLQHLIQVRKDQLALAQRQDVLEVRQAHVEQDLETMKAQQPPAGKLTVVAYRQRYSKPYLPADVLALFKKRCRALETPEKFQPDGAPYAWEYFALDTLERAYGQATRQLSFLDQPLSWSRRQER